MKSSIRISRGGRSITFRGGAARAAFEGMTGTKLPAPEAPKKMDPNRFTIGERVKYVNHVTGEELGTLQVTDLTADHVYAVKFFGSSSAFKFHRDGRATWSSNLSIWHEGQPNPHAEEFRKGGVNGW